MRLNPLVICLLLTACQPPYDSEAQMTDARKSAGYAEYNYAENTPGQIHVVETGDKNETPIVFVHGAPGGWEAWGRYLSDRDLLTRAHLIAVDRPGYGGSRGGYFEPSLAVQARHIHEAIKPVLRNKKAVWVGHSFGGPVIAQIAMDYPESTAKVIFLAASVDPDLEKPTWYQNLAVSFPIRYLIPAPMLVAAQEIVPLKYNLQLQNSQWCNLTMPITVIQGERDKLVPPKNADYIARKAVASKVTMIKLPDANHFLPWAQFDLIKTTIMPDRHKGDVK